MTKQNYNPTPKEGRRTKLIHFTRQLWPQPPPDSRPYWYGLGDLAFYQGTEKVWDEQIPEARCSMRFNRFGAKNLSHPGRCMKVIFDQNWGWLLSFELSHKDANRIWGEVLSEDFRLGEHLIDEEYQQSTPTTKEVE